MSGALTCPTCGGPHPGPRVECEPCRKAWRKAQASPAFVPTVPLFPELEPPRPAQQLGLGLEDDAR